MRYKVILLTSGVGSRLGNYTDYTNKSLVRVGNKPTISRIIDNYPMDVEFVVTLGYYGNQVREFLEMVYPEKPITFVEDNTFDKEGRSLICSLLQTKDNIDCPFVFHVCDAIIRDEVIPEPSYNWLGGYVGDDSTNYATLSCMGDYVKSVYQKGQINFDSLYIGLAGVHDYKEFFKEAESLYSENKNNTQLSDIDIYPRLIRDGIKFKHVTFNSWLDIGNTDGLKLARKKFDSVDVLDKDDESIYIIGDNVVKFFYNENIVSNRVKRAQILKDVVPNIVDSGTNFYMYEYAYGRLLSEALNPKLMEKFLDWSKTSLWIKSGEKDDKFYETCRKFYVEKTNERLNKFFINHAISDKEEVINGYTVPKVFDMLKDIPESYLCSAEPYNFHGDFISDNIIVSDGEFVLLDWRQDFGGELGRGDIYYDLGKLNHNLIFNHELVNDGHYSIVEDDDGIHVDLLMRNNLYDCQKVLFQFINKVGLSESKVDLMSSIIWLNMAPLHNHPLDIFLYYFGKMHLYVALKRGLV